MATEKFICSLCGKHLHIDPSKLEEIVPNRFWAIKLDENVHHCGHESVFARGEAIYSGFFYKANDKALETLSDVELSKWKNKVYFHYLEEGVEDLEDFKDVMFNLIKEIDSILKNPKIKNKQDKIRILAEDKLGGYKEKIKRGGFEREREKYVPDGKS
ncbi:hypothetical protein GF374_02260 [Candidatus Woesearchaeota archaeon]|nr:hypothetical protein [Candidatus Woesearchaeota archaeon]